MSHREGFLRVRLGGGTEGFTKMWCALEGSRLKVSAGSHKGTLSLRSSTIRKNGREIEIAGPDVRSALTLRFATEADSSSWSQVLHEAAQHATRHHHSNTLCSGVPTTPTLVSVPLHRSMTLNIPRRISPANSAGSHGRGLKQPHLGTAQGATTAGHGGSGGGSGGGPIALVDLVRKQHESNYRCCDCNDTQSVEWISINLLCVVCIKCSGAHRSLGSHISKVRSLTLDNFTSPEVLHLLRHHVSNANVNAVYEGVPPRHKITPQCSDAERSKFIVDKYKQKCFVDEGGQDVQISFRRLVKAIHLNSVCMLQRCLAQSKTGLREMVQEQAVHRPDEKLPTVFQYSLKHHDVVHGRPVYYITEFLLFNGLPVDDLPPGHEASDLPMYKYWKKRFESYGGYPWVPKDNRSQEHLSFVPERNGNKRWSLNAIPSTAQVIMAPTNLLSAHKSLRLSKRGHSNRDSNVG